MVDAIRTEELYFLLETLRDQGDIQWPLLEESDGRVRQLAPNREPITRGRLTANGWERASQQRPAAAPEGGADQMAREFDAFVCHA